jgi:hypothetical protein
MGFIRVTNLFDILFSKLLFFCSRVEKLPGQPRDLAINDSNIIFIACGSSICMYRAQQDVLVTHPLPFEVTSVAVSPQGTQLAVGGKVFNTRKKSQNFVIDLFRIIKLIYFLLMVPH